jgi:hypothetical protein
MAAAKTSRVPDVTAGDRYECRVARLLFAEGTFVRRKVDLQIHFNEPFQITDIDVLVLATDERLQTTLRLGECKTSEAKNAPNAADRLLWNTGLQRLVGAAGGFLATHKVATDRVRRLADQLGMEVLDQRDIARREAILDIDGDQFYGPHHPDLLTTQREVASLTRGDEELRRLYWFVRSEFWFAAPVAGLKRALGGCRVAARRWSPRLPDSERRAVEWLVAEAATTVAVALVRIAGDCYREPPDVFERDFAERLAEGIAPYRALEDLSRLVDRYLTRILGDAGVDPGTMVDSLGAFAPRLPSYSEPLLEVVTRFAATPAAARDVARLMDWRFAAASLHERTVGLRELEPKLFRELAQTGRLLRTLRSFLVGQLGMPEQVLAVLNGAPVQEQTQAHSAQESQLTIDSGSRDDDANGSVNADTIPQTYFRHDLVGERAIEITGHPAHVVADALRGDQREKFTPEEVEGKIRTFLSRPS